MEEKREWGRPREAGNSKAHWRIGQPPAVKPAKRHAFTRRFEAKYGVGAVRRFHRLVHSPRKGLSDVGRHFGFSREYARQVFEKIYGYPYTKAYEEKCNWKRRLEEARSTRQFELHLRVKKKLESEGLFAVFLKEDRRHRFFVNGFRVGLRFCSSATQVGQRTYYRIGADHEGRFADCDFVICLLRREQADLHFVLPQSLIPKSGVSLIPNARSWESKYAVYQEAWDMLARGENRCSEACCRACGRINCSQGLFTGSPIEGKRREMRAAG